MFLLRYAFRSLQRQRTRTALTMIAVVLVVGLVTLGHAFINGMTEDMFSQASKQTGHVRIRDAEYAKKERLAPLDHMVKDWKALRKELLEVEGVDDVVARIHFGGILQYTDESTIIDDPDVDEDTLTDEQIFGRQVTEMARAIGLEPSSAKKSSEVATKLVKGEYFSADDAAEILIGAELSRRLGVGVGQELLMVSHRGGVSDVSVKIVGVFRYGNKNLDRMCVMPIDIAGELLRLPDQATELMVFADDYKRADALYKAIEERGITDGMEMRKWTQIGVVRSLIPIFGVFVGLLLAIIIIIAVVGLLNTMLMTVLERQKEIGVLMALGLNRVQVVTAFVLEGAVFGLLGSAIGALAGVGGSLYFANNAMTLAEDAVANMPINLSNKLVPILTWDSVLLGVGIGVVVSVLGALWPAIKASGVNPVETMRRS